MLIRNFYFKWLATTLNFTLTLQLLDIQLILVNYHFDLHQQENDNLNKTHYF